MNISDYRNNPISKHSNSVRKQYVKDIIQRDGSKFKKGAKVLFNIRGKNVEAEILKDHKAGETSLSIKFLSDGREMRKDLATMYGIVGEDSAPKVVAGVPEGGVMAQKIKEKLEQKKKQKEQDESVKSVVSKVRQQRLKSQLLKNKKPAGGKVSKSEFDKARADLKKKLSSKPKTSTSGTQTGPTRPPRGIATTKSSGSAPKPLPRDAPPRSAPKAKPTKPKRQMSDAQKKKISAGVKNYHAGCIGNKKGKDNLAKLKAEVTKLKAMV
tara:strand:+ start:3728 stop:4531 length:804 start_codon:yes stop_codon:yes gene_type:complete